MNAAREGWKVFSDCGHTWWFSRAASRPVSLSNYITFDVCFFSGFMKSSIIYAVTLRTVIRFETMIWPITELKKSLDIFLLWLERKHSEEYLVILLVVKRKLWAIFLPRVYLEKIATRQSWSLSLNLQGFILDSGFSETLHSQYMSLWIKIVVILNVSLNYISCLECLSRSPAYRFASCCFSRTWTSHAGVFKMLCVSNKINMVF